MNTKLRSDVWSLLKRNISKGQLLGYIIANIVGLSVVLIGVLFFTDSQHSTDDGDMYFSNDYIVLSKKVAGIGFTPNSFSDEDIERLSKQPWVKKIGNFTASQFTVHAGVTMGGKGLSTYMFFESVPDEFFDIKPRDWEFEPGKRFVPVILSKDYLTLYNYGFAIPQNLPQLSEKMIGLVPISLRLTGEGGRAEDFECAIVGFSSRLNTIAVPQSFMDWANEHFAPGIESEPSRLIVEIDRLASADMDRYFEDEDIEVAGDGSNAGNMSVFFGVVSGVVATNGMVICLLALFILILSIFLMLQKSRATLRNIMLLGYSPRELGRYYNIVVVSANVLIAAVSLCAALMSRSMWNEPLSEIGIGGGSLVPVIATAAVYLVAVTCIDLLVISRHLARIWHDK